MIARLLWVDDEIDLLRPHCLFLEKRDYEVSTATNGRDAIELCQSQTFDLVLLDENMPGLSGLETLSAIKDLQPTLPVVMVTKNEAEDLMDQAIGAKIADYLLKPVNPMQILLTLKKNLHQRDIVQEQTETNYRQAFAQLSLQIDETRDAEAWKELYRRLVHWELQLADAADPAMSEMLRMQKSEANQQFAKFIRKHYEQWIGQPDAEGRPLLSHEVLRHTVFPRLSEGRRVVLLVMDNFRYDQWRVLSEALADDFDIDENLYYGILPTATQYARNALLSGLMPLHIKERYPELWVEEDEDESKNQNEEALIGQLLARYRRRESYSYHKLNDSQAVEKLLHNFGTLAQYELNVLVINFIDILSHARTESRMVRELASNEAAYRSITLSWFRHTAVRELFKRLAQSGADIILTTDHGSIRVDEPTKVVGDRNVNTNLRYKLGKNLSYAAKEVYEVKEPRRLLLPAPNLSTTYIFALGTHFFAYPNNYNHYVQYYRDTFQHGGISMEEMIVPLITMRGK
ncbi:MAG: PglZ domain-containing protein [Bacteroidales bacterium]|nr:PglZ domain-containing protein [Bacteroidales bacterium]